MSASELTPAQQYVKDQAREAAARGLRRACAFVTMHAGGVGFKATIRSKGFPPVLVRWDQDEVLRCYDATTFELMYQSQPGQIDRLAIDGGRP